MDTAVSLMRDVHDTQGRVEREREPHCLLTVDEWEAIEEALRLSPREGEIVRLVFDDLKEAAIAERLGISAHTVHTHLERVYRKAGVCGRASLIVEVFAQHLKLLGRGPVDRV